VKPRLDVEEWHEAVEAAAPDVHLDEHADADSYTLMRQADVVATYGSTTGVEAAYAGRPVMVMGPSAYDELGCATRVMDRGGIARFLDDPRAGDVSGAIAYGLMMRRRGFNFHHVTRRDGVQFLGGVPIVDSHEIILKLSHLWNRTSVERLLAT
jgi:hypothetical protein